MTLHMHTNQEPSYSPVPKVDRSALVITTLHDESDEKAYWLKKPPQQRFEAIELNRRTVYGYGDQEASQRLQRVLEVVERKRSGVPACRWICGGFPRLATRHFRYGYLDRY